MGRIDKDELGHRQQLVMKCIWDLGGKATVPQMVKQMEDKYGAKLSSQGMNTMVSMLMERGLLKKGRKIHQAFIYEAVLTEEEFQIRECKRVRSLTFDGSAITMMASLLQTGLTEEELTKMRDMIDAELDR